MAAEGNEPAYPDPMRGAEPNPNNPVPYREPSGLSKREYFAAVAMQGLLSNPEMARAMRVVPDVARHSSVAETAVLAADALIEALNTVKQL
jgi:hypothetical protein